MKSFLSMIAIAAMCLIPQTAKAEDLLGTITLTAGASKHNRDTAVPFTIAQQKVTIQCTVDMWVCTDRITCSATEGYYVGAQPSGFPTSISWRGDISAVNTYAVSIFPVSGTTGNCRVFARKGDELVRNMIKSYTYFGV